MYLTLWALGAGFGGLGFLLVWVILARYGGLNKANTFQVVFGQDSPLRQPEGAGDWRKFKMALALMGMGAVFCFAGVSNYDRTRLLECRTSCQTQGFETGILKPQKGGPVCDCQGKKSSPMALPSQP